MGKFFGLVGFAATEKTKPGVWTPELVKLPYYGDVLRENKRLDSGENLNDNLSVDNTISIMADDFADQNFSNIRCVEWKGAFWKVTKVGVQRPHLILTIGGIYNGSTT